MARHKHVHAWNYEIGGGKHGPVIQDGLITLISSRKVKPDTLVWRQGMDEWRAADETELGKYFDETGAPGPDAIDAANKIARKAKQKAERPPMGETRSVAGFQKWLQISLCLYALGTFGNILAACNTLFFYQQIKNDAFAGDSGALDQAAANVDMIALYVVVFTACCFVSSATAYGFFFQRALTNLKAMHIRYVTAKPFGSWAWYFVPIASLWKPLEPFSQARNGSSDAAGLAPPKSGAVSLWWSMWIIGQILSNVSQRIIDSGGSLEILTLAVVLAILAAGCLITAAITLLRMVGAIARAHESARASGNASVFD